MGRLDGDRARADRLRAERGVEPSWGPGPPPARRPVAQAPAAERQAVIARLRDEFGALSYVRQLEYLTGLRRRLFRLYGDEDEVSSCIRREFKPLLKKPGTARPSGPLRSPAAPNHARAAAPGADALKAALVELVRRHPGRLTTRRCTDALAGRGTSDPQAAGLRRDPAFGRYPGVGRKAVRNAVRALNASATVRMASDGTLSLAAQRPR